MIEPEALYKPLRGELVVVQVTVPNLVMGEKRSAMAHWAVGVEAVSLNIDTNILHLDGLVQHAKFVKGIDMQIDNQKAAIDRLLDHLKQHCPKLMGTGKCPHLAG